MCIRDRAYPEGQRIKIAYSRAMVRAALSGALDDVPFKPDPVFGLEIPQQCPGVPDEVLIPRDTWADPSAYDTKARQLAAMFTENFAEYAAAASPEVRAAGPTTASCRPRPAGIHPSTASSAQVGATVTSSQRDFRP